MPAEVRILSIITRMGRGGSERRLLDVLDAVPGTHVVVVGRDSETEAIEALSRAGPRDRAAEPRPGGRAGQRSEDPDAAPASDPSRLLRCRAHASGQIGASRPGRGRTAGSVSSITRRRAPASVPATDGSRASDSPWRSA